MEPTSDSASGADKKPVGIFVVNEGALDSADASIPKDNTPVVQDSIDERLGKVSQYENGVKAEGVSVVKEVVIQTPPPVTSTTQTLQSFSLAPIGIKVETSSPPQSSSTENNNQESYHTISGGPETVKDTTKKDISTVVRVEEKYSMIGMPVVPSPVVIEERKISLGFVLFQVLACVDFIFFMVSIVSPMLVTILVEQKYLLLSGKGIYSYGNFSFPRVIPDNMLHFTVALSVFSLFAIFIGGIIDIASGPSTKIAGKVLIFFIVLGFLGGLSYYFISNSPGAVTFFRVILTPYGIVI